MVAKRISINILEVQIVIDAIAFTIAIEKMGAGEKDALKVLRKAN